MMQVLKARQRWSDYSVLHIKNISMCLLTEKNVNFNADHEVTYYVVHWDASLNDLKWFVKLLIA